MILTPPMRVEFSLSCVVDVEKRSITHASFTPIYNA